MSLGFCGECGKPLQAGGRFCANCGHEFDSLQVEAVDSTQKPEPTGNAQISKMSKKTKILVGIVAVIAVALFSAHAYIKSIISTEKQIAAIHEAVHEENGELFLKVVHVDEDVIFDSDAYMELLAYDGAPHLIEGIKVAIHRVEEGGLPQFISAYHVGDILKVEREKYLGIYNKINITALAYDVKFETDLPSGKIMIGDKEWDLKGEPIHLGRFLPSYYEVLLTNADLGDATLEKDMVVTSNSSDNVLTITKDAYMVSFAGEHEDGLLSIDGKETGKKVGDMPQIGPLFAQNPIQLSIVKEIDGEQLQSAIVEAYPGDEVSFVFEIEHETEVASATSDSKDDATKVYLTEEEVILEAQQFVLDFRAAYENALNQRDFSLIDPFLLTDSVAYKELVEFVGDLKNENYNYDFTHNEITDGFIHRYGDILIDTYELFDFTNHKGHLTRYEREKTYYLETDTNGDFRIYSILIRDTVRE